MAGLVWHALKNTDVPVPRHAIRLFQASVAQCRAANDVRFRVLGEVLEALDGSGIPSIVLKGPALVGLVYGDPALRPMSDLDLLVARDQALRAQRVLNGLGFADTEPVRPSSLDHAHHLPGAVRLTDGVNVLVEVHHNVFSWVIPASLDFDRAWPEHLVIESAGYRLRVPGREHALSHLCWSVGEWWRPFRLLTVADIVGLASQQKGAIAWPRIAAEFPAILNTLALIDRLVPLDELRALIESGGTGAIRSDRLLSFEGWPPEPLRREGGRKGSVSRLLCDTLYPPEWWIRLADGVGLRPSGLEARVCHLARLSHRVSGRIWRLVLHRLRASRSGDPGSPPGSRGSRGGFE